MAPLPALAASVSCKFPSVTGDFLSLKKCATETKGSLKANPAALSKIKFDEEGLAGGFVGKNCYWMKKTGELERTHCFDNGADPFQEGLVRHVSQSGKFGYMDKNLQVVIPAVYDFAQPFGGGVAMVCIACRIVRAKGSEHAEVSGGNWSLIDKNGRSVQQR